MKNVILAVMYIVFLSGFGDYDDRQIPKLKLSKEQQIQLTQLALLNWTCTALARYTSELESPIEGESFNSNGITAFMLALNSGIEFKKETKFYELRNDNKSLLKYAHDGTFKAVIEDLKEGQTVSGFYEQFSKSLILDGYNIHNCRDVSSVTRIIIDPYFM
ncbi:hypothetical protein Q9887_000694 [Vibrio fluvialis]|nr:hypothetical protein [Vibrio fluvialis]